MRWLLLVLVSCSSRPLYLPEGDMARPRSPAIVACNSGQCDRGLACCTVEDGIAGSCVEPESSPTSCYSLIRCDGPEDCPDSICCDSQLRFGGTQCSDRCDDIDSTLMCHDDSDCPSSAAHCCPRSPTGPLKHCLPLCWT